MTNGDTDRAILPWSSGERRQAWDRMPDESVTDHALLLRFLRMDPPRSFKKLAQAVGVSHGHIRNLASLRGWRERERAWQARLDEIAARAMERAAAQAARAEGIALRDSALFLALSARRLLSAARRDPSMVMSPKELATFASAMVMLSRAGRGEPGAVVGQVEVGAVRDRLSALLATYERRRSTFDDGVVEMTPYTPGKQPAGELAAGDVSQAPAEQDPDAADAAEPADSADVPGDRDHTVYMPSRMGGGFDWQKILSPSEPQEPDAVDDNPFA